jgi:hypothetical protein
VTEVDTNGDVGQLSNTMVALTSLPIHVGGAYTVDDEQAVVIS